MSATSPKVVFGVPIYNKADYLRGAVESMLDQHPCPVALVLVDDCSTDGSAAVAHELAAEHPGVVVVSENPVRLGMIGNWRRCFELAREHFPDAPYFAWGSDHDVWRPGFAEELSWLLDRSPETVAAFPRSIRIDEDGNTVRESFRFGIAHEPRARRRLSQAVHGMSAGAMVYSLIRADALERAGVFRYVLNPDRLLMAELAMQGELRQVPETLWERRFVGLATKDRQKRAFFPAGAPAWTALPSGLTHFVALLWALGVRGEARPAIGRCRGLGLALEYGRATAGFRTQRRLRRLRKRRSKGRR